MDVCRLAAGEHQAEQKDVHEVSVSDAFAFFVKTAREKKAKYGSEFLSDNQVAMVGKQLGIQLFRDRNGAELNETQSV